MPSTVTGRGKWSGGLGHPGHRVARAQVLDAGVCEGAADQHPAVRGEREHMGDHPAVREDLRWVAQGVDERLVQPAFGHDGAYLVEERRPDLVELGPDVVEALGPLGPDVV